MAKTFGYYRSDKKEKISHQNGLNSKEISQYFRNVTKFLLFMLAAFNRSKCKLIPQVDSVRSFIDIVNPLANVDDIDKICTHRL
ncbi:unnamed protein product [Allacma fusca]|uniref:Uncharacterized protein n=1 Tax=Allacma fusca TaxID=39272 RepID=A0A8J2JE94_9HEXA|nr:unnamed protein product [Allacma fusca]